MLGKQPYKAEVVWGVTAVFALLPQQDRSAEAAYSWSSRRGLYSDLCQPYYFGFGSVKAGKAGVWASGPSSHGVFMNKSAPRRMDQSGGECCTFVAGRV